MSKKKIKYLGIILDMHLTFREHLLYVIPKVRHLIDALGRLMPNLRGPSQRRRLLYAYVVQSVLYYGAPIWADRLNYNSFIVKEVEGLLRTLANKVVCGYRTISYMGASLLAKLPPFRIRMERLSSLYWKEREEGGL